MNATGNRIQIFSELVGLQAWHLPFTAKRQTVGLHADVSFAMARLGEESTSPVRFRLTLKRAVLSVEIPETEPLIVDPASVARDRYGITSGVRKQKRTAKSSGGVGGDLSVKAGASGASGAAGISVRAATSVESVDEMQTTTKVASILISHSTDERGVQHWSFEPGMGAVLQGKPWDSANYTLMNIRDGRAVGSKSIEPSVRFRLSCRREDLHIHEIEYKEKGILKRLAQVPANKMIAAEAYPHAFRRTAISQERCPGRIPARGQK